LSSSLTVIVHFPQTLNLSCPLFSQSANSKISSGRPELLRTGEVASTVVDEQMEVLLGLVLLASLGLLAASVPSSLEHHSISKVVVEPMDVLIVSARML